MLTGLRKRGDTTYETFPMALSTLFRREISVPPSAVPAAPGEPTGASSHGVNSADANRLALLELMRAWEAGRVRLRPDARERVQAQQHLDRVIQRYSQRVINMRGVSTTHDLEVALTALALVRSAVQDSSTVLGELNRLLNGGGGGNSQPAA